MQNGNGSHEYRTFGNILRRIYFIEAQFKSLHFDRLLPGLKARVKGDEPGGKETGVGLTMQGQGAGEGLALKIPEEGKSAGNAA